MIKTNDNTVLTNINHRTTVYSNLRTKKSFSLLLNIKQYTLNTFPSLIQHNHTLDYIANEYQDFIYQTTLTYSKLFNIITITPFISNAFEDLICKAIYTKAMHYIIRTNINEYNTYEHNRSKYQSFITLEQLGVTCEVNLFELSEVLAKVSEVVFYKVPQDKIRFIWYLVEYLMMTYPKENVVMLVVYCLLNLKIQNFKAHVQYAYLFRGKTAIDVKEDYAMMVLFKAIAIIDNLYNEHDMLTMTHEEFEYGCKEYEKKMMIQSYNDTSGNGNGSVNTFPILEMLNTLIYTVKDKGEIINVNNNISSDVLKEDLSSHLKEKYFPNGRSNCELKDMSFNEVEQMYNDFKIVLKLIESTKMVLQSNNFNIYPQ